jgi:hypothetical protein
MRNKEKSNWLETLGRRKKGTSCPGIGRRGCESLPWNWRGIKSQTLRNERMCDATIYGPKKNCSRFPSRHPQRPESIGRAEHPQREGFDSNDATGPPTPHGAKPKTCKARHDSCVYGSAQFSARSSVKLRVVLDIWCIWERVEAPRERITVRRACGKCGVERHVVASQSWRPDGADLIQASFSTKVSRDEG